MKTFYYITLLLIIIFSTSCKTQKKNIKPAIEEESTVYVKEMNYNNGEKDPLNVTPESINNQKINELAKKKAGLLCNLQELETEHRNTNIESRKVEINNQIRELKTQISEFDNVTKATLSEQEVLDYESKANSLSKDC